ncbi:MAG: germination protein YpeB, partial [Clostridia bacterium]|nr:germination protein YpeB [Clostridia bacterium]
MAEKKKNLSSGAEKAEKLTRKGNASAKTEKNTREKHKKTVKNSVEQTKTAKKNDKKNVKKVKAQKHNKDAKVRKAKKVRQISEKKALKMKQREEKRIARAKLAAEKKQARLERKLAHKEKKLERIAALKEKRAERREKRKERRDMIKNESKQARRKRIESERKAKLAEKKAKRQAYLAEKKAKREHALKVRAEKRAERNEKRHAPGFGGWLAAVISLGVTTLALGTVVTFGWLTMDNMQADMASGYTQSLYELNSVIDNLDADLSRAKASSSASDRVRVLSDIAIESETAETILERFPLDMQMTEQMSSFINKMGDSAKQMLYTIANGGELTASQKQSLQYMYETNAKIKEELNTLVSTCDGKDLMQAMRGKSSAIGDGFSVIQNNTFETPKGIHDGPFSDSVKKTNPKALKGQKEITAQTA